MPKNVGGKRKNKGRKPVLITGNEPLPLKKDGQVYAKVLKMLGSRRMHIKCDDGVESLCIIPGKFKGKRNWISEGMVVLVTTTGVSDERFAVIYIYSDTDVKRLRKIGELDSLLGQQSDSDVQFVVDADSGEDSDSDSDVGKQFIPELEDI